MIRKITAKEYITPLREGGSLPAVIRADDEELYAMKFVGAGQGAKALISEIIAGEIARHLGFRIPEIVFIELDPVVGQSEPDAEIQDLLQASAGLNLGMKFLSHASSFTLLAPPKPTVEFASRLVWFDAFVTNVDRTPRNVNMMVHENEIWLIDHGASLYFQHNWQDHIRQSETPFAMIKDHVLLPLAEELRAAEEALTAELNREVFEKIVAEIPDKWLPIGEKFSSAEECRNAYVAFLLHRLENSEIFLKEAERARSLLI